MALPPAAAMPAATSFSGPGERPTSVTSAPSDANRSAVACPMPRPAPVTSTLRPSNRRTSTSYPLSAPAVRPRMK